jgi:hypothetical protein
MEGERKSEPKDESGFSERQMDVDLEIGNFKKNKAKIKKVKILFERKAKK